MKTYITSWFLLLSVFLFGSCQPQKTFDASGTFEAEEVIVSAEASGILKRFSVEEGQTLQTGQALGYIDSTQLSLKKKQLEAQVKSLGSRLPDISAQTHYFDQQLAVLQVKLDNLLNEQQRLERLVKADAATQKQLDDVNALISEAEKQKTLIAEQKNAQVSALSTQNAGLKSDVLPLYYQIEQLNDQLRKCQLIAPMEGTVLTKYAYTYEMTSSGKPLYKMADLRQLILRAYISGNQLPQVKINQTVTVLTDNGEGGMKETQGRISWISDKSEFTPKTIQTKDERANRVYAIKVAVENDGSYKIGMYAEIRFQ